MASTEKVPALHLACDPFGRLIATLPDGRKLAGLLPARCFPLTAPLENISLCDERGREVFCVERLDALDDASRTLLLQELGRQEFIPTVHRVLSISPTSPRSVWEVETDRGPARFTIPGEDAIRRVEPSGAMLTDDHGVRYLMPDIEAMDAKSRKLLRRYL
jgi:hypothetical protein